MLDNLGASDTLTYMHVQPDETHALYQDEFVAMGKFIRGEPIEPEVETLSLIDNFLQLF